MVSHLDIFSVSLSHKVISSVSPVSPHFFVITPVLWVIFPLSSLSVSHNVFVIYIYFVSCYVLLSALSHSSFSRSAPVFGKCGLRSLSCASHQRATIIHSVWVIILSLLWIQDVYALMRWWWLQTRFWYVYSCVGIWYLDSCILSSIGVNARVARRQWSCQLDPMLGRLVLLHMWRIRVLIAAHHLLVLQCQRRW